MKITRYLLITSVCLIPVANLLAETQVEIEQRADGNEFVFQKIPSPATNDAGTDASWKLVDGDRDRFGAGLAVLHDGRVPKVEDEPRTNFFLRAGSQRAAILVDLDEVIPVKRVSSYSRHPGVRAPQVYTLYGAEGKEAKFQLQLNRDQKPEEFGWRKIASVDTKPANGDQGGIHAASITDSEEVIGRFRYLLFIVEPSDKNDPFGQTFFSEIDIVSLAGPELKFVAAEEPPKLVKFQVGEGEVKYQFEIDVTEAPDLQEWSEKELVPVVQKWYPKIVEMLSSDGYRAVSSVKLRYRHDIQAGVPAYAGGSQISLNAPWFRQHLKDEARGCVVHEMVHIVQDYGRNRRGNNKAAPVPGWFVEGLADYIRWFLYEPESRGALLSPKQLVDAKYDASYRTSANFIDWVVRTHDKDLVTKLNAAARNGKYDDSLWEVYTRKRLVDLADEWRKGE